MIAMRYGAQENQAQSTQVISGGFTGATLIGSTYNATYTFTANYSNVLICATSGRASDARSEIATTAATAFSGYWRTSGTQGSLAMLYCPSVSAGDTVTITNGYGYPCIFVFQL